MECNNNGTTTKDYLVGPIIDEGAFGKVLFAQYKLTGKDVAIKVITKLSIQKHPQLLSCIYKEKRFLTELKSSLIIPLLACFHDSECLYFVMECASGGNLSFLISRGFLQEEKWQRSIFHYVMQLLECLEFIHSKNILHADLKPENILVTGGHKLVLADFGSSVDLNESGGSPVIDFGFLGTTDYASPEVIRGQVSKFSVGVDLWSFGCIIYAMIEGSSPFHDESDALTIKAIVNHDIGKKVASATKRKPTENWMSLIEQLISPEPSSRIGVNDYLKWKKKLEPNGGNEATFVYASLRAQVSFLKDEAKQNSKEIFQAPYPPWYLKAKQEALKDGAGGWGAFLL